MYTVFSTVLQYIHVLGLFILGHASVELFFMWKAYVIFAIQIFITIFDIICLYIFRENADYSDLQVGQEQRMFSKILISAYFTPCKNVTGGTKIIFAYTM